jgi:hypothetical protein
MRLTIHNCAFCTDGGSEVFLATDQAGIDHSVLFVQHSRPRADASVNWIPGRVYFDGECIEIRSEHEAELMRLLRDAEVVHMPGDFGAEEGLPANMPDPLASTYNVDIRSFLDSAIAWVESPEYIAFAEQQQAASNPTR